MFTFLTKEWVFVNWKIGLLIVSLSYFSQSAAQEPECVSETLNSWTGVITTRYTDSSRGSPYCKFWSIRGQPNMTVTISFSLLDLQFGKCEQNYVKIGPDPERRICNSFAEPYITKIRREHVWIQFHTDNVQWNRIAFTYIVGYVPSQKECMDKELRCQNGKCIPSKWHCNNKNECGDSSDESGCHDEKTNQNRCGSEWVCHNERCVPHSVLCNGIDDCGDHSDEVNCGTGDSPTDSRLIVPTRAPNLPSSAVCTHKYLASSTGYIKSPLYPKVYPVNCESTWTIQSLNRDDRIQIHFQSFLLQTEPNTDYLAIYDGPDAKSHLIGQYYGGHIPNVIESSGNVLFIKFHSNGLYEMQGFYAQYQIKGVCFSNQKLCYGERNCYYKYQQCNGVWDCPLHGSDELGCGRCASDQYSCGTSSSKCYLDSERCNGKSFCLNNADEFNCTAERCGADQGLFLCRNKRCIYQSWECDRTSDCEDHSDEAGCPSPFFTRRVLVAAVAGSLICSLLLVIALGCICKVYALRVHEQCSPRHESPLSRLQAEIFRRRAPPPPYHEAMLTSRPYEEARREYLNQTREQRRRRSSDRRRNRHLPPTPEEPSMHQLDVEAGSDDVQLLSLNSSNQVTGDASSTTELILPMSSSDSEDIDNEVDDDDEDDDDDDDDSDSVLLDLTENDGGTAEWHSMSRHETDEERSPEHVSSEAGCDSVDSASACLSVDEESIALHEILDKENGIEAEIVDKDSSVDQEIPTTSESSITSTSGNQLELIKNQ